MNPADAGFAEMTEMQKQSLQAAAKLITEESAERVVMFIFQLGFLEGMSSMARSHAARVDAAMRKML